MTRQRIHVARTADDVRLAWAQAGSGPRLVKAANWLSHLQYDWQSPVWRHWMEFFAGHFTFIRYDERGCGMSDWDVDDVSADNWLVDLECVIDAAGVDEPMILLGVSQGSVTVVEYAVRHPERVAGIILYGGYAQGWENRGNEAERHYHAVLEMMRLGWGKENPVFRQAFTQRFVPEATHEQIDWFNELCSKTVAPDMAVHLLEARARIDISDLLAQVQVPTLVIHARRDEVVPFSEGRKLASEIPGADFVELDSCNHILLAHEPAWHEFQAAVLEFTGTESTNGAGANSATLTRREQEVLELLSDGLSNADIAERLSISGKTVRNHLSNIYRKMDVHTRAQAIVRASAQGH